MDDSQSNKELRIPVLVDGLPSDGESPRLARCVYFTIAAEEPNTMFLLRMPNLTVPFMMLGLQGILFRPLVPNYDLFVRPNDWDDLVREIERNEGFSVEFEYFWLPVGLLDQAHALSAGKSTNRKTARGDVFRLCQELFLEAWRTARDGTEFDRFSARVSDNYGGQRLSAGLNYSPEESQSLAIWARSQALAARIQ